MIPPSPLHGFCMFLSLPSLHRNRLPVGLWQDLLQRPPGEEARDTALGTDQTTSLHCVSVRMVDGDTRPRAPQVSRPPCPTWAAVMQRKVGLATRGHFFCPLFPVTHDNTPPMQLCQRPETVSPKGRVHPVSSLESVTPALLVSSGSWLFRPDSSGPR